MNVGKIICFLLIYICKSQLSLGQESFRVSGKFENLSFHQLIKQIESSSSYHFFYDDETLDSVRVNAVANNETLEVFLRKLLRGTELRFAIDSQNQVFITRRVSIKTGLPQGFFSGNPVEESELTEEFDFDEQERQRLSLLENRIIEIGDRGVANARGRATITGYVRDAKNGEILVGAAVYVDTPAIAVMTDQFGYYRITLPAGRHTLNISSAGMKDTRRQILLNSDGKLNIEMNDLIASLKAVIVVSDRASNIRGLQMGTDRLSIKSIKKVPVVFGESDVLKVVLTLPGVTSAGEASTGINVRGGSADQNLILFNDATIYNPSHLFGFFSAFNPDIVKGVDLYKSSIPEKYGGRLSSVLDVSVREGNKKKFSGIGGIGPLTAKLTLEGPIVKDRSSYIISGRTTYSNWILSKVPNESYRNSRASFNDISLHITHPLNAKNQVYLTGYLSNDQFRLTNDTVFRYGNRNFNIKWKHIFNNSLYGVLTAGFDNYGYNIRSEKNPVNAFKLAFNLNQVNLKTDFTYAPSNQHTLDFGFTNTYYTLQPGRFGPNGSASLITPDELPAEQGVESALYIGDRYHITPDFSIRAGIRYSMFNYLGPTNIRSYIDGLPRTDGNVKDSIQYSSGKIVQTYHGPELRLAIQYALSENASIKAGYNTLRQYIHMLSNTTIISPTDIWKLSDPNLRPQVGDQFSVGFYKNFKSNTIETSIEVYYKRMKNFLDFKSGANLIMNHNIETDVYTTRGKAYGIEFLLKKNSGKLNGWLSYTYSRTLLQMDDPIAGEIINQGKYYPANFDKPHNANLIGNYRFSHRYSISMNLVYNTGRPITLPIAIFDQGGSPGLYYSDRNAYRIPDYLRADFSMTIEGNHKKSQLIHNSWSFGVYNMLARQNAYSVYFVQQNGNVKGYQLSIFGTAIPFVTYNFRF